MTRQQKAMRRNGLIVAVTGALFAAAVVEVLHPIAWIFLQVAYWPMAAVPADLVLPGPLLLAIGGGLTAGIGMSIWALGTYVAGELPQAAAKVVQVTAWSWFTIDSTFSVVAGAPFNAVLNLGFLALMLLSVRRTGAGNATPAQA